MYTGGRRPMSRFNADSAELIYGQPAWEKHEATSDALLQGGHGERLDDSAGGLRHLHLAEDLLLAGLRGRLDAGLDLAEAREGEDAVGHDLLRGKIGERGDDLARHVLLELELLRNGLGDDTLGHGLAGAPHNPM